MSYEVPLWAERHEKSRQALRQVHQVIQVFLDATLLEVCFERDLREVGFLEVVKVNQNALFAQLHPLHTGLHYCQQGLHFRQ